MTDDAAWNPFTALFNKNNEQSHKLDNIFRLLVQLNQKADHIMTDSASVRAALTKFLADFETFRSTVATQIADAVAKQQAGEQVDLQAMQDAITAADGEITLSAAAANTVGAPPAAVAPAPAAAPAA